MCIEESNTPTHTFFCRIFKKEMRMGAKSIPNTLRFLVLLVMLILGASIAVSVAAPVAASPTANLSLGKTLIREGDDFSTRGLGLPWDMKAGPYPDTTTLFKKDVIRSSITVANGMWSFTTDGNDPNLWMHWSSIIDTQKVLRLGDQYPIDADKYRLLSIRMCANKSDKGIIYWFYVPSPHDPNDPSETGFSTFFDVKTGCHVYVLDMKTYPKFQSAWTGDLTALRLDPALQNTTVQMDLDWVRLTTRDTSNTVPITWSGAPANASLDFFASRGACGADDIPIGTANSTGTDGTFQWGAALQEKSDNLLYPLPESLEPGTYHIYYRVSGGAAVCAPSTLEIRKAPILNFKKPSYFSGPDYASDHLNDPWGMSNSEDVKATKGFSSLNFSDGELFGITYISDPQVTLKMGPAINTSKYKYASFRMWIEGNQSIGLGWVHRFHWWNQGATIDLVSTEDLIVYEDWQTYSFDLSKAPVVQPGGSWTGSNPTTLRFDPFELPVPGRIHIDYITITADERVQAGKTFPIIFEAESAHSLTVNFFYDTDKNPNNGKTPLSDLASAPPPETEQNLERNFFSFLSLVGSPFNLGHPELSPLFTGQTVLWNTSGVARGTYYIVAELFDGVNTTTWYSDTPVIID